MGDKFGAGELILPFVLKSGKHEGCSTELEKYLINKKGQQGQACTVHSLRRRARHRQEPCKDHFVNNGYPVHDLGSRCRCKKLGKGKLSERGRGRIVSFTSVDFKQMQYFVEHAGRMA